MSHDTLIHRLVRPPVRLVARSPVTPNQVTMLRLVTALAAAVAFAVGDDGWMRLGAGVFLLSLLLDRADGELARQTGRFSVIGHRLDLISDCTANAAALVGLGFGARAGLGWLGPALGLVAGAGVAALFWLLNVAQVGEVRSLRLAGGRVAIDPDDTMVLLPLLLWFGLSQPTLFAAAAITPLAALAMALATWRPRAAAG